MMWHYEQDGQSIGPVDEAEFNGLVIAGAIRTGTLVWREGFSAWQPLRDTDYPGRALALPEPAASGDPLPVAVVAPAVVDELSPWALAVRAFTVRFVQYGGRARRKEFWSCAAVSVLLWAVLYGVLALLGGQGAASAASWPRIASLILDPLIPILLFLTLVPVLAVIVRRLHDTGYSGWWILPMLLVPYLGPLTLLVAMALPSQGTANQFGPPSTLAAATATSA